MNFTEHYQLNQWEATDRVLREDFNRDNAALEAALSGMLKTKAGTYVGTGTCGKEHPNSLTFPFPPAIVFVFAEDGNRFLCAIRGLPRTNTSITGHSDGSMELSWEGNTLRWHLHSGQADDQLNWSGRTYHYLAIGT